MSVSIRKHDRRWLVRGADGVEREAESRRDALAFAIREFEVPLVDEMVDPGEPVQCAVCGCDTSEHAAGCPDDDDQHADVEDSLAVALAFGMVDGGAL